MDTAWGSIVLLQAPGNCNGKGPIADFTNNPRNISNCANKFGDGQAWPLGLLVGDVPGWTEGEPGWWLVGMYANRSKVPVHCGDRLLWTQQYSRYDMSHKYCEYRIIFNSSGTGVACDPAYSTGLVPSCASVGVDCVSTSENASNAT